MKHWYALMTIVTVAGASLGCSGGDSGGAGRGAPGATGPSATQSADQSPLFNDLQSLWNANAPANNAQDTAFNSQDPAQNADQALSSTICESFCATVDPRCFGDCAPACDTLRSLGNVCVTETKALFACAMSVEFTCDEEGTLQGGDECRNQEHVLSDCLDQHFGIRTYSDQSSGRTGTVSFDAATSP